MDKYSLETESITYWIILIDDNEYITRKTEKIILEYFNGEYEPKITTIVNEKQLLEFEELLSNLQDGLPSQTIVISDFNLNWSPDLEVFDRQILFGRDIIWGMYELNPEIYKIIYTQNSERNKFRNDVLSNLPLEVKRNLELVHKDPDKKLIPLLKKMIFDNRNETSESFYTNHIIEDSTSQSTSDDEIVEDRNMRVDFIKDRSIQQPISDWVKIGLLKSCWDCEEDGVISNGDFGCVVNVLEEDSSMLTLSDDDVLYDSNEISFTVSFKNEEVEKISIVSENLEIPTNLTSAELVKLIDNIDFVEHQCQLLLSVIAPFFYFNRIISEGSYEEINDPDNDVLIALNQTKNQIFRLQFCGTLYEFLSKSGRYELDEILEHMSHWSAGHRMVYEVLELQVDEYDIESIAYCRGHNFFNQDVETMYFPEYALQPFGCDQIKSRFRLLIYDNKDGVGIYAIEPIYDKLDFEDSIEE